MNYKDLLSDKDREIFNIIWSSDVWNTGKPSKAGPYTVKGHWLVSGNRSIEGGINYDGDEGWNDSVSNTFIVEGWTESVYETQTPGQDCIQTDTEKLIAIFPLQIS